jgi:hypothetical protein
MGLEPPMDVLIHGIDRDPEQVARNLGQLFGVDLPLARRIVSAVPYVAKREVPADVARRYVRALTASGCRAEARPSQSQSQSLGPRPAGHSLPAPRLSALPELEAEERAAIARWREAEGLGPVLPSGPPRSSRELARSVPRAPRLPDDMTAQLPQVTDVDGRPGWLSDDPAEIGLGSSGPPRAASANPNGRGPLSGRPGSIGMARSSPTPPASLRDGSRAAATSWTVWRVLRAGIVLAALVGVGVWRLHDTEDAALRERWSGAGIDSVTPYMSHAEWIEGPDNNRFNGSRAERAPVLIDALQRSGVSGLWVVGYGDARHGRVASRLVVELPDEPTARQTALWHLARFRGEESPLSPRAKYVEVDLR